MRTLFLTARIGVALVAFSTAATAEDLVALRLPLDGSRVAVADQAVWLADPERRWTLAEVTAPPLAERFSTRPLPAKLTPGVGVWLRFRVAEGGLGSWLLVAGSPALAKVSVHWPRASGLEEVRSGWDLPFSQRPVPDPRYVFPVPDDLVAGAAIHLYVESQVPAPLDLSLVSRADHYLTERMAQWRRGLYYGALASLVFYNLFLFASIRDPVYLLYSLHIGGFGLAFFGFEGLAAEHLWPEWPALWRAPLLFLALSAGAGALYVGRFLGTGEHLPRADLGLRGAAWIAGVGALSTLVDPMLGSRVIALAIFVFAGCALSATVVRWRGGFRPARFLFLAQVVFLVTFPLVSLSSAELVPSVPYPVNFLRLSVAFGALLLSFGLADRLRTLTAERERLIPELETRNAELERLSYTLSHDVRNPLLTILNFTGSLEHDASTGETSRLREDLATVRSAAAELRGALDDLLDVTRRGLPQGRWERVELAELVAEARRRVADDSAAGDATFELGRLPAVRGDRSRLIEVFSVLIENALRHSGKPDPHIEIGAVREENATKIWIRDDGVGVAQPFQESIFGLFDKLDPQSPGRGVGLALARRIVEAHGGRIWVESNDSEPGITFVWTIPYHLPE